MVLAEVDCHAQIQGQCSYSTEPICDHSEDILIKCGTEDQCPETPTVNYRNNSFKSLAVTNMSSTETNPNTLKQCTCLYEGYSSIDIDRDATSGSTTNIFIKTF